MKWTKEQEQAINTRGKNILVAAAAGSGKTSVLVERIRKMVVEEGVPIRSFLVVTFTNKAAAEMKERLRASLNAELAAFSVANASKSADGESSPERTFSSKEKSKINYLKEQLIDLETANISTFHSFGLSIIRRFFYKLDIEPGFATADETEMAIMKEEAMDELLEREFADPTDEFISFMDAYSDDRSNDEVRRLILDAYTKLRAMPYAYDWIEEKISELATDDDRKIAQHLRTLRNLVMEFEGIYREIKNEASLIDFDDIEHYSLEVLGDSEVSDYYKSTLKYIFVDEYQDTNLMQEAILQKICGADNLFMVGDIKQSIYRFRLAEPSIFQDKYNLFKAGGDANSIVIDLNENHRSKEPIIDYTNKVFDGLMPGYDEDARLYFGIRYADGVTVESPEPKLTVLIPEEKPEEPDPSTDQVDLSNLEQETHFVARLIRDNLGKPFYDAKMNPPGYRPLEPKDIVVLRRSVRDCTEIYQSVLREYGIDSFVEGDDGYFDTMEMSGLLDLLQVIDNIRRDVPLIGALYSEIFNFSTEDLARIRINHKEGTFADAFLALADGELPDSEASSDIDSLRTKCEEAYKIILRYREMSRTLPLASFIWQILIDSGYYLVMGALPEGGRRQANLRMICDMAEKFGSARQGTLYDFLKYIESIKRGKVKMPEAQDHSAAEGGVAIMTIHKSKGLEFPMVIVSGLGKRLKHNQQSHFFMHKDIGVGMKLVDRENHWSRRTPIQELIDKRNIEEELEEEMRVLYVAMTRAQDRLYLVAHQRNDKFIEKAKDGNYDYSTFLGMLAPTVPYQVIRVPRIMSGLNYSDSPDNANTIGETTPPRGKTENISAEDAASKSEDLSSEDAASKSEDLSAEDAASKSVVQEILDILNYKYPHENARKLKSKYSVSEINAEQKAEQKAEQNAEQKAEQNAEQKDAPKDGTEHLVDSPGSPSRSKPKPKSNTFTAAERGTIYHKILETIEFAELEPLVGSDSLDALETKILASCEDMIRSGLITREELDAIDLGKVRDFFLSDIGRRCIKADAAGMLEKERPFTMKAKRYGEDILIQGIIDCYFGEEKDGEYRTVLLDYKSNWIDRNKPIEQEEERLRQEYSGQLEIYKNALEMAGMGRVCEVYLYLLDIGHGFLI